jgi:hypothetical protein
MGTTTGGGEIMKKTNNHHIRQGDVGICKTKSRNVAQLTRINAVNGRNILAYGEATGHHHSVVADKTELYQLNAQTMLLRVLDEVELEHQEHAFIVLVPGDYEVHIQVEYDPEGERRVQD